MIKNKVILLLIVLISTVTYAQIVDIPDSVFKDNLVNQPVVDTDNDGIGDTDADINNDGEIQVSEAEAVIGLHPVFGAINSFEGLQSFINIEVFECSWDPITSIDVSTLTNLRELLLEENQLLNLDISHNTQLEYLNCNNNSLTTLDLSENINLKTLFLQNNDLIEIDVTNNANLEILAISNNDISTINLNQNSNLISLGISGNPIDIINVSSNFLLEELRCGYTSISTLELLNNVNLKQLHFNNNNLSAINLTNNVLLEFISFNNNQFIEIDISSLVNLKYFQSWKNQLVGLDFSSNPLMKTIYIVDNNLTSLNLKNGNNSQLSNFNAFDNENLYCIEVDDPSQAPYVGWNTDYQVIYSEDCSLGIEEFLETQISLYPNPTKGFIHIESNNTINSIKVFDVLGKLVFQENNHVNQLDISSLDKGLFFVKIETDQGISTQKVIKQI